MTVEEVVRELKINFLGDSDYQREAKNNAILLIEELEVYKEALDYLDSLVSDICANTNECFNECTYQECDEKRGKWAEFALQKVSEEK